MATNLTTAPDHPAALLQRVADAPLGDFDVPTMVGNAAAKVWFGKAAEALRLYEGRHDVTFAALDNEALARVREAYEAVSGPDTGLHVADLVSAISDLLGLDD